MKYHERIDAKKIKRGSLRGFAQPVPRVRLSRSSARALRRYLTYCRRLQFEERPDYGYLRHLFREAFEHEGV